MNDKEMIYSKMMDIEFLLSEVGAELDEYNVEDKSIDNLIDLNYKIGEDGIILSKTYDLKVLIDELYYMIEAATNKKLIKDIYEELNDYKTDSGVVKENGSI